MLIGDFNEIIGIEDRRGQITITPSIRPFRRFLNDNHLLGVNMLGKKYTWGKGNSRSRIDWCLYGSTWYNKFLRLQLSTLHKHFSDHNPLWLQLDGHVDRGSMPFQSLDAWLKDSIFKPLISTKWRLLNSLLPLKLKALKQLIKKWEKEEFGVIDSNVKALQGQLEAIEHIANSRPLKEEELARKRH